MSNRRATIKLTATQRKQWKNIEKLRTNSQFNTG
jgi:hypothetical protein